MNIIFDISNIHIEHYVKFLDTKPNNIMPGEFTKIIYSNDFVSLNGLYIDCPLDLHIDPMLSNRSSGSAKYNSFTKSMSMPSLSSQSLPMSVNTSCNSTSSSDYHMSATLTAPSSTSTVDNTRNYVYFQPNQSYNAAIIQHCRTFEERLLSYYMKYMFCSKRPIFLLNNILSNGSFKYYCDTGEYGMDYVEKHEKCVSQEIPMKQAKYIIKISGVWETVDTVGLTYKFLKMYG